MRLPRAICPRHHDDPFDRMLVAQAIAEGFTLVTSDTRLRSYQVAVVRRSCSTRLAAAALPP
jgi:PIN domain nuclease of toxin-antitoxin system